MEEMMKEVEYLREELKKKDQIITQLTHHQQQESVSQHSRRICTRPLFEHFVLIDNT